MALGTDYADQDCAMARTLEIVGERWTLLIIRDMFYGLRRYSDFRKNIGLSPALLTARLGGLVDEGVVARVAGSGAHDEYELTAKGEELWPVISALATWGNKHYMADGHRQVVVHALCGTPLAGGFCPACELTPDVHDIAMKPRADARLEVERAMGRAAAPHRMLDPIRL